METSANSSTILVVEDDCVQREGIAELLEEEGFRVKQADNGRAALDYLDNLDGRERPCLILLDLLMPVMGGYEFRRLQLSDEKVAGIPVVVTTSGPLDPAELPMNVEAFVSKPISIDLLLKTVRSHCPSS